MSKTGLVVMIGTKISLSVGSEDFALTGNIEGIKLNQEITVEFDKIEGEKFRSLNVIKWGIKE